KRQYEPLPTPFPPHSADLHETEPVSSLRLLPILPIPDPTPEASAGDQGGQSSNDKSQSGSEDELTLQGVKVVKIKKQLKKKALKEKRMQDETISKQGRNGVKSFKEEGTALHQGTDKKEKGTDKPEVSTDGTKLSTDSVKEGTDEPELKTSDAPTVLLNMSQAKAISKEKEKGVEFKDVEESERPRTTSTRSLLTLRKLPKINPKDKGKKVIVEEEDSDTESEGLTDAKKKFDQIAHDEEVAKKVAEEWETEEERKRMAEEEATKDALS
ncbi:hypothetical protein Tco_0057286, partial [Tanacetum coccineum]